jgi:hypothetical protein
MPLPLPLLDAGCYLRSGFVKWTINLQLAAPACSLRHSKSGDSQVFRSVEWNSCCRICTHFENADDVQSYGILAMVTINWSH